MRSYDLMSYEGFEIAKRHSGVSLTALKATRFGLAYASGPIGLSSRKKKAIETAVVVTHANIAVDFGDNTAFNHAVRNGIVFG